MLNLLSLILIFLNLSFGALLLFKRRRRKSEPPLVSHVIPFVGAALEFGKEPLRYLRKLQEQHGDVFTIKLAGWNVHVFMNYLDIRNLEKTQFIDHKPVIGDFVTRMVGNPHSLHRPGNEADQCKCNENIFKENADLSTQAGVSAKLTHSLEKNLRGSMQLSELCDLCKEVVTAALQRTFKTLTEEHPEEPMKLYQFCKVLVFDITYNMFFGSSSDEDIATETKRVYDVFKVYFKQSALLVDRIPIHLLPETKRARAKLLKMMAELSSSRRTDLSSLMKDLIKDSPTSDGLGQVSRHLLIILWSAQANTAPALFWTLYHILTNQNVKRAIKDEFQQHRQKEKSFYSCGRNSRCQNTSTWPEMTEIMMIGKTALDKMIVLDSCLKETMRLCGSSMSLRKATRQTKIQTECGKTFVIRKGDYTTFYAPVIHLDPEIFEKPEKFVHDRFLCTSKSSINRRSNNSIFYKTSAQKEKSNFSKKICRIPASKAIMTFGYGTSRCPGRHIAMIEIKLVVLALLQYFEIDFVEKQEKVPSFDLTHLGFGVMPPAEDIEFMIKTSKIA